MNKRYPALWQGIVFFVAVMLAMLFIATPIQLNLGLVGVALTEVILLLMALCATLFSRKNLADVFPLTLVRPMKLFGAFIFYGGMYYITNMLTVVLAYFFPQLNEISEGIATLGTQLSPWTAVIIMAILPAVCEEAVFRGFILSSFKSMKSTGSRGHTLFAVLAVGVMFGIFHLDPLRMPITGLLGAVFAYITLECGSMISAMILHLVNNSMSVVAMYMVTPDLTAPVITTTPLMLTATVCFGVGIGLLLTYLGWRMLGKRRVDKWTTAAVILFAVLLVLVGYGLSALSINEWLGNLL